MSHLACTCMQALLSSHDQQVEVFPYTQAWWYCVLFNSHSVPIPHLPTYWQLTESYMKQLLYLKANVIHFLKQSLRLSKTQLLTKVRLYKYFWLSVTAAMFCLISNFNKGHLCMWEVGVVFGIINNYWPALLIHGNRSLVFEGPTVYMDLFIS